MVDAQNERAGEAAPHILAMNNDAAVLQLFRDLLEEEHYRVSTRAYLDKDLSVILDLAPDLIVVDYMWPGDDNGWSLLQMLRMDPRTAPIPVVLCTAAVREVEALHTHLADLRVAVVIKPFELETLLDTIAALLVKEPASDG